MEIISITGTKGKTTVARVLSYVFTKSKKTTLRVDTDGHYINEKQKSTLEESKKLFSLVPTVCPGKYLLDMKKYYPEFIAVFEAAIGSSGKAGIGYGLHQVGVFTNVLEDHLGQSERLKTRMDIAKAKKFIFSAIDKNGWAVFNADDKLVCSQLKEIPSFREVNYLPVGFNFNYFDIKKHFKNGGSLITEENGFVVMKDEKKTEKILRINDVKWAFNGLMKPLVFNLMLIIGALFSHNHGKKIDKKMLKYLSDYQFDKHGGRLTRFKNKKGVEIIVDYAHEKYSLKEVAKLAEGLKCEAGKVIGVLRLAPDRSDKMILDTGKFVSSFYDKLIIYDKIDGVNRKEYVGTKLNIRRKAGEVSSIFLEGALASKNKKDVERIVIEKDAIKKASEIAEKGDVVVIICNDDHRKTINYVEKFFRARRF